jgi:hypothetical protein
VSAIIAGAAAWLAYPLVTTGLDRNLLGAAQFHPLLLGRYGIYQAALAILIGTCMLAYAAIWRVNAAEALAAMFALIIGACLALLLLNIDYNPADVIAVVNPLEKMLSFADSNTSNVANGSSVLAILLLVLQGIGSVLARYTFVLHSSPRPTVFLVWLIIPGIILAWRRGERQTAIQALLLLLAAVAIDALAVRRGLKVEYFIYTDPLIILSGALLLDDLRDLRCHKWAYIIALTLFALHIAVGQAEPIKYALKRSGRESICQWNRYYMPLMPLPWCPAPTSHA